MDDNKTALQQQGELKRTIGFWPVVFFGLLSMGPTGAMTMFPIVQPLTGGFAYLAYVIATVVVILTVLSYQQMLQAFPEAGSAFTYSTKGINAKIGFLVGWILMIDYAVVPMFTLRLNAIYFTEVMPGIPEWVFVLVFGILITLLCCVGLKLSTTVQMIIGVAAMIVLFVVEFGAVRDMISNGVNVFHASAIYDSNKVIWGGVFASMAIAFLSFLGFDGMTTLVEETTITPKKLSKALMVTILLQAFFVISSTYLMGAVMDWQTIPEDRLPTAYMYMLEIFTSTPVAAFLVTINNISILANILAFFTISSRILFSMGRNGVIPKSFFGKINPKLNTPINATLFIAVISVIGALAFDYNVTAEIISFGGCVGFLFVNISVITYFWFKQKDRKFFSHLLIPALAALSICVILVNLSKVTLTVGIIWSVIGVLYLLIGYRTSQSFRDSLDSGNLEM